MSWQSAVTVLSVTCRMGDNGVVVLLGLLGPLELRRADGTAVPLNSLRQRRLLAALSLHVNASVGTGELIELVWGEKLPADPAATLHSAIARLRRALPPEVVVETGPGSYRLAVDPSAVDATRFAAGITADSADNPAGRAAGLDALLALWRGTPFVDLDHPIAAPEITRLVELRAAAIEQRAQALFDTGRFGEAATAVAALVGEQPLREHAVAVLARALAADGRQSDALAVLRRLRRELAEQLGLDPSAELRRLEQRVLRQEVSARAAPPLPVSSFVGRDAELRRIGELLGVRRIVSLCGPGGVGKSRLSLHVASAVAPRYADGVVLVELAATRDAAGLAPTVAAALHCGDGADESLTERIVAVLAMRNTLLLLDNCEHLAEPVARFAEAITIAASAVDVLATSREALRADGEQVVAIHPLEPADAVTLLAERIHAADSEIDTEPAAMAEIANRLDGLPLALELAAARAPELGLAGLRGVLDEPLETLGRGRRTAANRHRSLRAVVEWSFTLLGDAERELFVRLGVFGGPVEFDVIAAVCTDSELPTSLVRSALTDLVGRSLVVAHPGATPRYGMLETLRAFARSRIAAHPQARALRERHAGWAIRLADEVALEQRSPREVTAVARFDAHSAELTRAHRWLRETGQVAELLRLAVVLAEHAHQRGKADLAQLVEDALACAGDAAHPLAARLLGLSAQVYWQRGDLATAQRRCERAIGLALELDEPTAARDAHDAMANVEFFRGKPGSAREHGMRAAELANRAGDRGTLLLALTDLAIIEAHTGDEDAAAAREDELAALAAELGSPTALAWAAYVAGERRAERDPAAAVPLLERALRHAEAVGADFVAGVARHTLVTAAARVEDPVAALPRFAPLIDHWHRAGAWTQLWIAIRALIETLSRRGRHAEVARLLGAHDASIRAAPPYAADARRLRAAAMAAREALGERFGVLHADGRSRGDEGAVALALSATRG